MPIGTVIKWDGEAGYLECDDPRIPNVQFFVSVLEGRGIAVGNQYRFKIRIRNGKREGQELQLIGAAQYGDEMSQIYSGRVLKWISERGFGFADSPEGDVFLHVRDLMSAGLGEPSVGDSLKFSVVEDQHGRKRARPIEYAE